MNPRYRRAALAVVVALGMLSVVPGVAFAANPACGTTIMSNTTLTGDLDCSAYAGDAITFGKKGLTFNLGGYTLWGPVGDDTYSGVATNSKKNVTVKHGTISGFDINLYVYQTIGGTFKNLTINGDASTSDTGIYLSEGADNVVQNNNIADTENGVDMDYSAGNWITDNTVTDSGSDAFYLYYESGDHLVGNHATGYEDDGFFETYSGFNVYQNNHADAGTLGGYYGFNIDCEEYGNVTLTNNTATGNASYGIYTYSCFDDNALGHVHASVVSGNVANDNIGGGFYDYYSLQAKFTNNTAKRNGTDGFHMDYPGGITFNGNVANANSGDGVEFYDIYYGGSYAHPKSIRNNTANGNDEYGINAQYGLTRASGNVAHNNGYAPDDCLNVACN